MAFVVAMATTFFNRFSKFMAFDHYLLYLSGGNANSFFNTLTGVSDTTIVDIERHSTSIIVVTVVAAVVAIVFLLCGAFTFIIKLEWMSKNRAMMMRMFTNIPTLFLDELSTRT